MLRVFFDKYSVMPGYFLFKKVFFDIGPFINTNLFLSFLIISMDFLKLLSMYLLELFDILVNTLS